MKTIKHLVFLMGCSTMLLITGYSNAQHFNFGLTGGLQYNTIKNSRALPYYPVAVNSTTNEYSLAYYYYNKLNYDGYNTGNPPVVGFDRDYGVGYNLGVTLQYTFLKSFALRSDLMYLKYVNRYIVNVYRYAGWVSGVSYTAIGTQSIHMLSIPLHLVKFIEIKDQKFELFSGAQFNIHLAGTAKTKNTITDVNDIIPKNNDFTNPYGQYITPTSWMFQAGVGYHCQQFLIRFQYQLGLTNLQAHNDKNPNDDEYRKQNELFIKGFSFSTTYFFNSKK